MPQSTVQAYFIPQPLSGFTLQGFSLFNSQLDSSPNLYLRAGSSQTRCKRQAACATNPGAAFKVLLY